jgi:hypothetical protein
VIPIAHSGKGIFDLLPTASSTIVSISETSGDVIGNGKAPFESLLENRARDGRVQGGSVDMVTYNSLTVDDEDGTSSLLSSMPPRYNKLIRSVFRFP